jgi:hypothetical protein
VGLCTFAAGVFVNRSKIVRAANLGGAGRTSEGVDVEFMATEDGLNVGRIRDAEWLKFTRFFPWSGRYALQCRVASMGTQTYFDVYYDDTLQFRIHVGWDIHTGSYSVFTDTNPEPDGAYIDVTRGNIPGKSCSAGMSRT